MNKYNRLIFILSAPLFLLGCNKASDDLKVITDEANIIKIANNIVSNQDSESFGSLDNFLIKTTQKVITDELLVTHKKKSNKVITQEFSCDLKNYLVKEKSKETTPTSETELETIYYYDNSLSAYYILTNKNNYKSKTQQTEVSVDTANKLLKSVCSKYITNIKNRQFLNTIEPVIAKLKQTKEEYKSRTGESYNYTFGSNDDKSLQLKVESKDKYYNDDLEGYITIIDNNIMRDNKQSYYLSKTEIHANDKDNICYMNNIDEQITTYTYGKTSISKPNVSEYTN